MLFFRTQHRFHSFIQSEDGGALPTVLILIATVSTFVASVLAVHLVRTRLTLRDVHRTQVGYAVEGALHRTLERLHDDPTTVLSGTTVACPDPVVCRSWTEPLGGLVRVVVRAHRGPEQEEIRALVGRVAGENVDAAVVVSDAESGLSLAGSAEIHGTVVMTGTEVHSARMGTTPFTGRFNGSVRHKPGVSLPLIHDALRHEMVGWGAGVVRLGLPRAIPWQEYSPSSLGSVPDDPFARVELSSKGSLRISASDQHRLQQPVTLFVPGSLTVMGPLSVPTGTRIVVRDTLRILGEVRTPLALLYAGHRVDLRDGVRGCLQVGAGESVSLTGSRLDHPSTIAVRGTDADEAGLTRRVGRIEIGVGARVDGTLLYVPTPNGAPRPDRDDGLVAIHAGAALRGLLYSAARTTVRGVVQGTVLTRQFYVYHSPTHYYNWILDGQIDPSPRLTSFLLPIGVGAEHERRLRALPVPPSQPPSPRP